MNSKKHSGSHQSHELKRELGFWAASSIVIGCVIGSGVFVKPGKILTSIGGSNAALLAWLLGGIISIAGGLTIAEVAARIPKTGGVYTYIEEIYGKTFGFLCGWVQTVIYGPGLMAALSLYFGILAQPLLGLEKNSQTPIAFGALFFLVLINCVGAKYAGRVQELTTVIKLIPIFMISVFGLIWGTHPTFNEITGIAATGSLGGAVLSTLWAYDGWMQVTNMAGEMKNPSRDLPRAIIFGLAVVALAYLAVNISLLRTLSTSEVAKLGEDAARMASVTLFGPWGGSLVSIGIVISIFGCLNGNILSNSRVPYAMALRKELPFSKWIGSVHPKLGTPNNAIILQTAIAVALMLWSEIDLITDLAIFSIYIFFTLAFIGLFILRKKRVSHNHATENSKHHLYQTPCFPYVPLIAIGGCAFMLISKLFDNPQLAIYFCVFTAIGMPLKYFIKGSKNY
ncbi:MAG: amino acid permease [Bdellovibrionales bacterium]|nr:amino acid permease [Bdellovibrionales bacterium]